MLVFGEWTASFREWLLRHWVLPLPNYTAQGHQGSFDALFLRKRGVRYLPISENLAFLTESQSWET